LPNQKDYKMTWKLSQTSDKISFSNDDLDMNIRLIEILKDGVLKLYFNSFDSADSFNDILSPDNYVDTRITVNADGYGVISTEPLFIHEAISYIFAHLKVAVSNFSQEYIDFINAIDTSNKTTPYQPSLGILGGGQLGRMLALAARKLGIKVVKALDPGGETASAAIAAQVVRGNFNAVKGDFNLDFEVVDFVEQVDILTVEIEHVNAAALLRLQKQGKDIQPAAETILLIQDKFIQKQHFAKVGVELGEYRDITSDKALTKAASEYGYPFMLKSRRGAYDGRGNFVVNNLEQHAEAVLKLGGYEHGLYAEKWQKFCKELAVIVVRSRSGELALYPVSETIQKNNICHVTETPAFIPEAARIAAEKLAKQAVASLSGAGVFGVEMFLLDDGRVLLNEVAPRVHNSGHYTLDACVTSQFENHIRAVMGMPLGETKLRAGHAIMLNILGVTDGIKGQRIADRLTAKANAIPGCSVHWYDKSGGVKLGRKVGHINITGDTAQEVRERLALLDAKAAASLSPLPKAQPKVAIIMGSDSDLATMSAAAAVLEDDLGVSVEVTIVSAHRTPDRLVDYARSAYDRGIRVIIAGAGGAAHLPGMVAALTPLPVVGVPVVPSSANYLNGVDALLSILQMPGGIPVATVAIGNAKNGGLEAARILATSDPLLYQRLLKYHAKMRDEVLVKADKLESKGWREYIKDAAATAAAVKKPGEFLQQFASTAPVALPKPPVPAQQSSDRIDRPIVDL